MNSMYQSFLRSWRVAALTCVALAAVPVLAAAPSVAAAAPPVDGLILSWAAYVALLLLAMGTAWFLLLIPVPAPMAVTLRRALAALAVSGLLAGGLNQSQLNAVAVAGFAALLMGSWRGHRSLLLVGALALAMSRALIGVCSQP